MKLFYKTAIIFVFSLIAQFSSAQNADYNLPPGYGLIPNKAIFDLSYKLDGKVLDKEIPQTELEFLKEIDDSELHLTSPEYQQYIQEGKTFINSLSEKVKSMYTNNELWYIYAFDQKLKNRLVNIH